MSVFTSAPKKLHTNSGELGSAGRGHGLARGEKEHSGGNEGRSDEKVAVHAAEMQETEVCEDWVVRLEVATVEKGEGEGDAMCFPF